MSFIISSLLFIASFLIVISVLVFFHELGHYSVARLFNVSVERFSIGFGKPIMKWKARSGTEWTVSRWPLGGYVKFLGDMGAASNPDTDHLNQIREELEGEHGAAAVKNCFHFKPLWQRALIVLAGPVANFILAIVFFAIVAMTYGRVYVKAVVQEVVPGGAAEAAGVMPGDIFLTLDGLDVRDSEKFIGYIALNSDETLTAEVERDGELITFPITPRRTERRDAIGGTNKIGTIGAIIGGNGNVETQSYGPAGAVNRGVEQTWHTISMTGTYLKRLVSGRENGSALGGPTRIATMTGKSAVDTFNMDMSAGEKARTLFWRLMNLAAALSVGLGIANLMPIPALDGGHLLFYGYEAVAGRPLSEEKQEFGFRLGFALLFTALIVLTINDIGYIRSLLS